MRIDLIDLPKVFGFAKLAANSVIRTSELAGDSILNFSERQLEHEIGAILVGRKLVTYYDCPYPDRKDRADLLAWQKNKHLRTKGGHCIWIEAKLTSWCHDPLSQLTFQKDFNNLAIPKYPKWGCTHHAYWVWFYLFDRRRSSVGPATKNKKGWLRKMTVYQALEKLKYNRKPTALCRKVEEISTSTGTEDVACSIMASPDKKEPTVAALLIVARLS